MYLSINVYFLINLGLRFQDICLGCWTAGYNIRSILLWICNNANTRRLFGWKIWRKNVVRPRDFHNGLLDIIDPASCKLWRNGFYNRQSLRRIRRGICRPIPKTEQKSCVKCCIYTMSQFQGFHFLFVIYLGSHLPCHDFYDFKMAST